MNKQYFAVSERAEGRCEYCHAPESVFNFPFEVEHIRPSSIDGSEDLNNLALSCHACNRFKSSFIDGPDPSDGVYFALYNPRHQTWADHFQIDRESGTITGKTPTGRATVQRLRMNRDKQLLARQIWLRLDLFP